MKKATIAIALFLISCLGAGITGRCENIVSYSDEYVSFDYDTDIYCELDNYYFNGALTYFYSTNMKTDDPYNYAYISLIDIDKYEENNDLQSGEWTNHYFSNVTTEHFSQKIISDNDALEIETIFNNGKSVRYSKLLGFNSESFAVAQYSIEAPGSDTEIVCKKIYDSACITDIYSNGKYSPDDTIEPSTIFSNILLSEQGLNYVNAAIDVLEQYLSFQMDSDEASKQIEAIKDRSDDYAETSDYIYDSRLSTKLYVTSLSIDMGSDGAIAETLEELKQLANYE